jgi:hypothetical protein
MYPSQMIQQPSYMSYSSDPHLPTPPVSRPISTPSSEKDQAEIPKEQVK